jgi:O-antigen/teichoic acid export membrane protein
VTATSVRGFWDSLRTDVLLRNSLYLMLTTAVTATSGFGFWLICSRLFTPADIGPATTLMSATLVISYVSLLGFNSTFVSFLPTSTNRDNEITTGLLLSMAGAIALATLYILAIPLVAPAITVFRGHVGYALVFVVIAACSALNLLTDSIFVALRAAKYNLIIDGLVLGSIKLLLPFALFGIGSYGVYVASGAGTFVGLLLSIYVLMTVFDYRPSLRVDRPALSRVAEYSSTSYVANIFNMAPVLVLPVVVLNHLGAAAAAYYALAIALAHLLYAVIYTVSQSLFAEGSHEGQDLAPLLWRSTFAIGCLLLPSAVVLFVGAELILRVFGESYATGGTALLRSFAAAAPVVALFSLGSLVLRIERRVYGLIVVNVVYCLTITGLAYLWVDRGLVWIGYAWIAGNLMAGMVGVAVCLRKR